MNYAEKLAADTASALGMVHDHNARALLEQLINEVVDDTTSDLLAVVTVAIREGRDPVERLRALAKARFETAASAATPGDGKRGER